MAPELSTPAEPNPQAWQPLTFGGVAAFGRSSTGRLFLVAGAVAVVLGWMVVTTAHHTWVPALAVAITNLPPTGSIDGGQLRWPGGGPTVLSDSPFLAIRVNPGPAPEAGQSADVQVEFQTNRLTLSSLLGQFELPYPSGYAIALNRPALQPLWGAWRPHLLFGLFLASASGLLGLWMAIATLCWLPLRAYSVLLGRAITWGGCWRLGVAALLPGALVMGIGLFGYGLRRLGLGELLFVNALHLFIGAAYLLIAPLCLPGVAVTEGEPPGPDSAARNPFAGHPAPAAPRVDDNPFAPGRTAASTPTPPPSAADTPPPRKPPRTPGVDEEDEPPLNPS